MFGRYEAAAVLESWFDHLIDLNGTEVVLRQAAGAVTELYLRGDTGIREAIRDGFLERVLEQPRSHRLFEYWAHDPRLRPAWEAALAWGEAHPAFVKGLRETNLVETPHVDGVDQVVAWWGRWITFHDFYLLSAPEAGSVEGELVIHGWVTDWKTVDDQGYFTRSNDCVVRFKLTGIRFLRICEPDVPGIIHELKLNRASSGWTVRWVGLHGDSTIEAEAIRIDLTPGAPARQGSAG